MILAQRELQQLQRKHTVIIAYHWYSCSWSTWRMLCPICQQCPPTWQPRADCCSRERAYRTEYCRPLHCRPYGCRTWCNCGTSLCACLGNPFRHLRGYGWCDLSSCSAPGWRGHRAHPGRGCRGEIHPRRGCPPSPCRSADLRSVAVILSAGASSTRRHSVVVKQQTPCFSRYYSTPNARMGPLLLEAINSINDRSRSR